MKRIINFLASLVLIFSAAAGTLINPVSVAATPIIDLSHADPSQIVQPPDPYTVKRLYASNESQPTIDEERSSNYNMLTGEQRQSIESVIRDSTSQIWFEQNVGQFPKAVRYGFRTTFGSMLIYDDHLQILANQTDPATQKVGIHAVNMSFVGSNGAWQIVTGGLSGVTGAYQNDNGEAKQPYIYKELTIRNVYDGVDLRLYSAAKGTLEFDWLVARAQDYQKIQVAYSGQDGISYGEDASMTLGLRYQNLTIKMPETYQVINGTKHLLDARMVAGNRPDTMRYELNGNIVTDQPLVIDPNIEWSTYIDLNNTNFDSYVYAIAVNNNGVYVGGWIRETVTNGSFGNYMEVNAGFSQGTANNQNYVYRLNNTGLNITAWTSTGVDATSNASVSNQKISGDAIADVELFPDGRVLVGFSSGRIQIYAANLATRSYNNEPVTMDTLNAVAIVSDGSFYASGRVNAAIPSGEIPAANIGPDATYAGSGGGSGLRAEGVIVRYSNATTTPTPDWATYIGGDRDEYFTAISITPDKSKLVFATSTRVGSTYPTLVNAVDNTISGNTELLVGVLADGANKPTAFSVFSYLGDSGDEGTLSTNTTVGLVEATNSFFYVAGNTASTTLPGITGGAQTSNGGGTFDTFLARIPINGSAGTGFQTTFLGGNREDNIGGISYDSVADQLLVFGTTNGNFPVQDTNPASNYYQNTAGGNLDIFVSFFDGDLKTKNYASYFGGSGNDYLGQTGDLIGQGHVYYSADTGLSYLATTVHSTLPTGAIGTPPGKDGSKSNTTDDTHTIYAFNLNIFDYGDAPLSYENGSVASAAKSALSSNIRIGLTTDVEAVPASGVTALGDDSFNTDDENGIATLNTLLITNTTYSTTVSVLNNSGSARTLQGWIDFNRNGTFEAGEYASVSVPNNAAQQNVTLTWNSLPGLTLGQSYLRLRLNNGTLADNTGTSTIDERSFGSSGFGEVEDYALTIVPVSDLAITKTDGVTTIGVGGTTTYTVRVTNNGPSSVTGAILSDPVVTGLTKTSVTCSATPGQCTAAPTVGQLEGGAFALPALASGQFYEISIIANVTALNGNITNTATITTPAGTVDLKPGNNSASDTNSVTLSADLSITKTDGVEFVASGSTTVYTVHVTNTGPGSITGAILSDPPVIGLSKTSVTCSTTPGQCTSVPTVAQLQSGTFALPTLAAGQFYEILITANVTASSGSVTNSATITAPSGSIDPTPDNNSASDTDTIEIKSLAILKSASPITYDAVNDLISYTYLVTNTGNVTLSGPFTVVDDKSTDESCPATASLAPGASITCSASYTIIQSDLDSGSVTNIALAGNGTITSTTDTETVNAIQTKLLAILKSASPTTYDTVGELISYSYLVTNTGNVTLSGPFSVLDDKSTDESCPATASLAPGASITCTASYSIAQSDLDSGSVTNIALAGNGTITSTTDTETVTAIQNPAFAIDKTGTAGPVTIGDLVDYTITVTNTGNVSLNNVTLTDPKLGLLETIGTLTVNQSTVVTGSYGPVTENDLPGPIFNTASVTGTSPLNGPVGPVIDTHSVPVKVNQAIAIDKSADQTVVEPGTLVTYFYTVTNPGQTTLTVSAIHDDKCSPLNPTIVGSNNVGDTNLNGKLDVGEQWQYRCNSSLSADTLNTVVVTGTPQSGVDLTSQDTAFVDVRPTLAVTKTADPLTIAETGGYVTYTYLIQNTSAEEVVIASLVDDRIPTNFNGDADCHLGTTLNAGESCSFSMAVFLAGDAPNTHTNTLTVRAEDNEGNEVTQSDDAVVTFIDMLPTITVTKTATPGSLPETGGAITFTYEVGNSGLETVTISALSDDIFGTLAGDADCQIGTVLAPGETCSFTTNQTLTGNTTITHTNIFTANAKDDENNTATDNDSETVTFTDVKPTIVVTKTATPGNVPETGGVVTFTYEVGNSGAETVTISALDDNIFGTLAGNANCQINTVLAPGKTCSFSSNHTLTGNTTITHTNIFTATAQDDEQNDVTAQDDADVTFTDVKPVVGLTKSVTPLSLPEPGGVFTFTLTVQNSGLETTTIQSLSDDYTLSAACLALVNNQVPPGADASCQYTVTLTAPGTYTNTANVLVADDEGNQVESSDDAIATVTNVDSSIKVTKTVTPTTASEMGETVAYHVVVENTSLVDSVYIEIVNDDIFGNISGSCTPDPGTPAATLLPGEQIICNVTKFIIGNAGESHINTVTASGVDDDGFPVNDSDNAEVIFTDVPSSIQVTKSANPTSVNEPGGDVTYTVTVKNTSPADVITVTSVLDDKFGNVAASCLPSLLTTLQPNESTTCSFVGTVSGNANDTHTNTISVAGIDDDGTNVQGEDSATVTINNVNSSLEVIKSAVPSSVDEPGGNVTFTVVVRNTSPVDHVDITKVEDDIFGDISNSCSVTLTHTLTPGEFFTCSFTRFIGGNTGFVHTDVVTATGTDDDGQSVSANDDATVTIGGLPSSVEVVKTANPTSLSEPGGWVTYTVYLTNTSVADDVTINSLNDDKSGDVTNCAPQLGSTLKPGEGMLCTFSAFVSGQPGSEHINVVTAATVDDENNEADYSDDATVTFNDIASSITVIKNAQPAVVPEPGGWVTYTVFITNTSAVDNVTIDKVEDDKFGDVSSGCTPALTQTLAPGQGLVCTFSRMVNGEAGATHSNTVTVTGIDDDENPVSGSDSAVVAISNVGSTIQVSKIATPSSISEPSGTVNYKVTVENTSPVDVITITTVLDDKFGNIGSSCTPSLPAKLAPGGTLLCSFTRTISGNAGDTHTNLVTVTGIDDDQDPVGDEDSATVTLTDVPSSIEVTKKASTTAVSELGSNVTYSVIISNSSPADKVTITSVIDDKFGNIGSSCQPSLPAILQPGGSMSCLFTRFISGQAGDTHTNVVSVVGIDDDGKSVNGSDEAAVNITDVASSIVVNKTANPATISEPGGDVTFTVEVRNSSPTDSVTMETVSDDKFGDISDSCVPALPVTLKPNATLSCSFVKTISGNAGDTHTNIVTVAGTDDDGQPVTSQDSETVTIGDVASSIKVTKGANPLKIEAPGANVTYTVQVANNSAVDVVTINTVIDNKFGDVSSSCTPKLPVALNPGEMITCRFTRFVNGNGNTTHTNVVTVSGEDDDGKPVTGNDSADVQINEAVELPPSQLDVTKSTSFTSTMPTELIVYTIAYSNTGAGDAVNVLIVETVPQYTSFNAANSTPGWQCALDNQSNQTKCQFAAGNLSTGQKGTLTFAITVNKDIPEAVKNVVNLVTIRSNDSINDPADSDVVMTPVIFPTALDDSDEPSAPGSRKIFLPLVSR